jgi:hypothetical protein
MQFIQLYLKKKQNSKFTSYTILMQPNSKHPEHRAHENPLE